MPLSDEVMKDEWYAGLEKAVQTLMSIADCAGLFGLTGGSGNASPGPLEVLARIGNSYKFQSIDSPDGTVTSALKRGVGSASTPIPNGSLLVSAAVEIRVNNLSNGASFVTGGVNDWATTLLHELGNAYWDLYGDGTSAITPDGPSAPNGIDGTKASIENTNRVKTKCKL
jgi:hypothetical protein